MKKSTQYWVRKSHRYLGLVIGIQFIFWTVGGLYFSWTDIDEIHGDQFMKEMPMHHLQPDALSHVIRMPRRLLPWGRHDRPRGSETGAWDGHPVLASDLRSVASACRRPSSPNRSPVH